MSGQRVYFAAACGKIKIGCSVNPEYRMTTIGEWIPFPIKLLVTIPGSFALEAAIHRMFDAEWSHGEWFEESPRLLAFVERIQKGLPLDIDVDALATRRRAFIADKKRVSFKQNRLRDAGGRLPKWMDEQLHAVPKGQPIPPVLLKSINDFIDEFLAKALAA